MSGGKFDYVQYRIDEAAEDLSKYSKRFKKSYESKTLDKLRECEITLRRAAAMLQRVDWLLSGDDGEESFHERWKDEVG